MKKEEVDLSLCPTEDLIVFTKHNIVKIAPISIIREELIRRCKEDYKHLTEVVACFSTPQPLVRFSVADLATKKIEGHPRKEIEYDVFYKQLIVVIIIRNKNHTILLRRGGEANEKRLAGTLSYPMGHVAYKEGNTITEMIHSTVREELAEELNLKELNATVTISKTHQDFTNVGASHIGVLCEVKLSSDDITKALELKTEQDYEGVLYNYEDHQAGRYYFDTWTESILGDYVKNYVS